MSGVERKRGSAVARGAWIAALIWALAVALFVWSRSSPDLRAAGGDGPPPGPPDAPTRE